jgi:hypothetical protein
MDPSNVTERTALQDDSDRSSYHYPESSNFRYSLRNQVPILLLAVVTAMVMSFTVFLAYNSTLEHPLSQKLVATTPEQSILILNIASQITIFCLGETTHWVFETVRWALASSQSGIAAYTFLLLSRATSVAGVIYMMFGRPASVGFQKDGYRIWGSQRYANRLFEQY